MSPRFVMCTVLLAGAVPLLASAQTDCRAAGADCTLREAAAQAGVVVGSTVRNVDPADVLYEATLAVEFNSVTNENAMKWQATQPSRGAYEFSRPDALVEFAEANGMGMRGHNLIWDQELLDSTPAYVSAITDEADLRALLTDHIQTVVGRYRGRVDVWDVVNEPLETVGSAVYHNVFYDVLGPGYIAEAFELAHAADPDALLVLNEVLLPVLDGKLAAMVALVTDLLAQGVPIHGVGIQGHYFGPPNAAKLKAALEAFTDLGLFVELTEVDIVLSGDGTDAVRRERQRDEYFRVAAACLSVEGCRGITTWGFTDRHTWIDSFIGPGLAPLPFDEDYQRKPAFFGLRDGLLSTTRPVSGKKLAIRGNADAPKRDRLVATAKDGAIEPAPTGALGDPTVHGGTLHLRTAGSEHVWVLPADGWKVLGRDRGYRYKDKEGTAGPIRTVVFKTGRAIKIVARGEGLGIPIADDPTPVVVSLSTGAAVHCVAFEDSRAFKSGRKLRAARTAAPASCGAPVRARS